MRGRNVHALVQQMPNLTSIRRIYARTYNHRNVRSARHHHLAAAEITATHHVSCLHTVHRHTIFCSDGFHEVKQLLWRLPLQSHGNRECSVTEFSYALIRLNLKGNGCHAHCYTRFLQRIQCLWRQQFIPI